jgi:hypothetical protein
MVAKTMPGEAFVSFAPIERGASNAQLKDPVTTVYLGDGTPKKARRLRLSRWTTDKPLPRSTFLSLPECRTKSKEFTWPDQATLRSTCRVSSYGVPAISKAAPPPYPDTMS